MDKLILVIEDDIEISKVIKSYLTLQGYRVNTAFDGEEGVREFRSKPYDLVLLDIMMPKLDGMEVLREIRDKHNTPVIIVSAKDSDVDKALGLGFGADDYLTKPFSLIELQARVSAAIRRATLYSKATSKSEMKSNSDNIIIADNGLVLDANSYEVKRNGKDLKLTAREFKILKLFFTHPNQVFTKNKIYESVWGEEAFGEDNIINVHIRRIREKIELDSNKPEIIKTVWGIGYKYHKES
ncbi:MAG: response regulator transcription factor [Clostridium sp.]